MTTTPRVLHPRFPLFSKIIAGFALIIFFMVLSSFFLLFQMNDAFRSGETEFRSFQLAQDVERRTLFEQEAASRFFASGDSNYVRDFRRNSGNVVRDLDSLMRNAGEPKTRSLIEQMAGIHSRYS